MQKAVQPGGEDLAADDGVPMDQQVCLHSLLTGGVIIHLIGVPLDPLAGVFFQRKPLLALEGQILLNYC